MKHQAIYNLYPNAKSIRENDTLTAYDINGNEIAIDMSAVNTKATELQAEYEAEKQAKVDNKASARQKLIDGEPLTEEEAKTVVI